MEVKPGYKLTEVGVIPEDWECRTVKDIGEVGRGRVISHREIGRSNKPEYPVYSSQTSDNGVMGYLDTYDFEGEYVTWTTDGANAGTVFYRNGKFNCTNVCGTIRPLSSSTKYLALALARLTSPHVSKNLGNPKLMNDIVKKILVAFPPLPEQTAIATTLSDVDALISSLDALISKKKQIKQGAMQELLSGKRRLPGFSGEWEVKRLGDLFVFSGGFSASREQLGYDGYCYLHYGDIHMSEKSYIDVSAEFHEIPKLNRPLGSFVANTMLSDGDIVFVDASEDTEGTSKHIVIINPGRIPFISGLHTIVAKARNDMLDCGFRRYCFQSQTIKQQFRFYAVGTKVSGISKSNIIKINMALPPLPEQQAIATILSDMDAEITTLEARRDKTKLLKQGMMQELLTGRIRLVPTILHAVSA
ncbi:MAG: restriction endonuclease subunit S [Acidithiobacillus sp.]